METNNRNEMEAALSEAEWKFKALFELGPIGVAYHRMIYDADGKPFDYYFIDANESYFQLTGVNPKGMTVREAFPGIEKDTFDWIEKFGHVALTGETIRFEQYFETNGRWYDCVSYSYKPDHFVVAFNEITEQKQTEIALKESEEKYRILLENSGMGVGLYDLDGKVLMFNQKAIQNLGGKKEDYIGKTLVDIFGEEVGKMYLKRIHDTAMNDLSLEFEDNFHSETGDYWFVSNHSKIKNDSGKIIGIQVLSHDITERKKMEILLENERSLYLDLVNTQPAGIYRLRVFPKEKWEKNAWKNADNPPYKMELISQKFCEILEINKETFELYPGIIIDLLHPDDKEEFVIKNEEANTKVSPFKWDCRLIINKKIKWVHFESLPRKLHNGDILFTGIIYDVTEQKIAQEELIKKNKDLDYLNKFMINREVRMAEMKKEVNELLVIMGKEKRYL